MSVLKPGDEFGWSPDWGAQYVLRDGVYYTEHGGEVRIPPGYCVRACPFPADGCKENFADWSPEKRAEVKAKRVAETEEARREYQLEIDARNALVESARAKLTEDEFDAVVDWAREDA